MDTISSGPKIVTVSSGDPACTVSPHLTLVNVNDTVTIVNQTANSIAVLVAEEKLLNKFRFNVRPGKAEPLTVQDIDDGDYPFAVFCRETDNFARASSMPIIAVRTT